MQVFAVNHPFGQGCFDSLQFERCGLIRLEGWYSGRRLEELELPKCFIGTEEIPLFQIFRTYRPDVLAHRKSLDLFQGFTFTYRLPQNNDSLTTHFRLSFKGKVFFEITQTFEVTEPAYKQLLDEQRVLHREDIYSFGAPSTAVNDEIFHLARMLPGPILDFGCGTGALVKKLRDEGIEAFGIEIERAAIVEGILPEARKFVHLYDGNFPLPYETNQFQSVFASEVIEHITNYETALSEIARIASHHFTITVPDISSVPVCHHNFVVPWHIIDSSHVNFFTQTSLERLLGKYFSEIQSARICKVGTNDSCWFVSLVGICRK